MNAIIPAQSYLAELAAWLAASAAKMRSARAYQFLARVTVAQDITTDAIGTFNQIAAAGHAAEVLDLEAEKIIGHILSDDPHLNAAERAELRRAARFVHRSAESDHTISELAHVPEA